MSLKIRQRVVSDVVILDVSGRITLAEGSVVVRDTVKDLLVRGGRKILLNLGDVSYIDSSGVGELHSAWVAAKNLGGSLRFVHITRKVHDLLQITKLYTVFAVFDDEVAALRSFDYSRYCKCPSCGSLSTPPSLGRRGLWSEQTCLKCNARFAVRPARKAQGHVIVETFRVQTYEQEYFEVVSGPPYRMRIVGRLNLFSSSALDKTWRAIPPPRRIVFDLGSATEIDAPGRDALLTLLRTRAAGARAVISLEGSSEASARPFLSTPGVYANKKEALAALGDISDTPQWLGDIVEQNPSARN